MSPILVIGLSLAGLLMVIGLIFTVSGERSLVDERLERYTEDELAEQSAIRESGSALTDWVNTRVESSSYGEKISRELARADMKFKPGEWIFIVIGVTLLMGVIGWFYGGGGAPGNGIWFAAVGVLAGPLLPRAYVKRQQRQRLVKFNDQLPDMLSLMVNGLRAGYSQMQALESVSKELPSPISDEFRRVVREIQLGIPVYQALDNLLRRIPSPDLDFIITAINIQRESGGNLAEILDIIGYTIRERIRITREIQVLVSQVLYSGRVLAFMPIGLAFVLWGVNREYMGQFFAEGNLVCGIPMLICGGLMIAAGYYVMTRIAKIEV
ncbi:MAG TPA: type II secretion system F family protein [Anaerolineales bacterium]|nr:type II secretion system F family protein [Anaerolineales bacterium]